jgi:antirestriction protein ArdC
VKWSAILADAVATPGVIHEAYSRFWNYSPGNQLLAYFECLIRGIELGPIHTFRGWHELGRHVKKGEKAITLCMPVTIRKKSKQNGASEDAAADDEQKVDTFTVFVYRRNWFVLSQTEGEPYQPADLPDWQEERALVALKVARISFTHTDGNCQGFARQRTVSVSPIAFAPDRTLFHELAHVVLGHTGEIEYLDDHDRTPRNLREVEAESVALICCESLGLDGSVHSRGYIQHWLSGQSIPEKSARRIFRAADEILKAGRQKERAGSAD